MTTPEPPTEPQQQCYEWQAQYRTVAAELTQARFEIEALQRRLAEYAGENQRLRAELDNERLASAGLLRANDSLAAQVVRLKSDKEETLRLNGELVLRLVSEKE
jgi:regulator of replication initiation timing